MATPDEIIVLFEIPLGILLFVGFIFLYRKYKRTTHRIVLFLGLLFLSGAFELSLRGMNETFEIFYGPKILWLYYPGKWSVILRTLVIIAIFETMSRENIRMGLIICWAMASALLIVLDSLWVIYPGGRAEMFNIILDQGGNVAYYLLCLTGLFGVQVSYKIYKNAPSSLKKQSRLFLIGFLMVGISLAFMELDRFNDSIPTRIPAGGVLFIGLFIIVVTLLRSPQLAYVLPFKVFRLSVIDINAGTSIFGHTWEAGKNFVDEDLYTGMVQGVRQILTESMRQGDLEEIKTEFATLLLHRRNSVPFMFCLATSGPSKVLKNVLNAFATEFSNEFGQYCDKTANTALFKDADALVEKLFLFVPK